MDVRLSRRGSYVVRSALCLARAHGDGRPLTRQQIAAQTGISRAFVSQILGDLIRADLAHSTIGKSGGYRLALPPAEVTLLDVVEAGPGMLRLVDCPINDGPCVRGASCALHDSLEAGATALRDELYKTTLAEVVERTAKADAPNGRPDVRRPLLPVTVADSIKVELAVADIAATLGSDTSWLARHVEAATEEGNGLRVRVGPGRADWLGKAVVVHVLPPEGSDNDLRITLSWEPTGLKGLFPKFDGELHLVALDSERSELSLAGSYHPPLGRAGSILDHALLTHVADATIRSFLRRVARTVEDHATPGTRHGEPTEAPRKMVKSARGVRRVH